jgi:hypothetical protein
MGQMLRYGLAVLAVVALATATPVPAQDAGLDAWRKIHEVFSHPRCANCHVGPDHLPVWSGASYGPKPRPHGMNISAGASRKGAETVLCSSCHTHHNSTVPHGAPGARSWELPPVEMQWFGRSSAEICAQIKDPARNGGRTIAKVAEHIEHDALVHWGWAPGPGREPAPYSVTELVDYLKQWDAASAPCPTS